MRSSAIPPTAADAPVRPHCCVPRRDFIEEHVVEAIADAIDSVGEEVTEALELRLDVADDGPAGCKRIVCTAQ